MKKHYLKPDAEYIAFYSDEEITSVQPLDKFANNDGGSGDLGEMSNVQQPGPVPPGLDWD